VIFGQVKKLGVNFCSSSPSNCFVSYDLDLPAVKVHDKIKSFAVGKITSETQHRQYLKDFSLILKQSDDIPLLGFHP